MNVETHLIVIYKIQLSCVIEKYFQFYEHPESKERAQLVNGAFTCKYFYQTQATRHSPSLNNLTELNKKERNMPELQSLKYFYPLFTM